MWRKKKLKAWNSLVYFENTCSLIEFKTHTEFFANSTLIQMIEAREDEISYV